VPEANYLHIGVNSDRARVAIMPSDLDTCKVVMMYSAYSGYYDLFFGKIFRQFVAVAMAVHDNNGVGQKPAHGLAC
jgi:hypothetical protein